MNRTELVAALASRLEQSKSEASETLDAVLDEIKKAVSRGESVTLPGFGVFESIKRSARKIRNPRTGEPLKLPETKVPKFRPGAEFKALVQGARKAVAERTSKSSSDTQSGTANAKKAPAKKASTAKKTAAKKTTAKKTTAKKAPAKKASTAKKTAAKKTAAKKTAAKKAPAKKAPAKKTAAKKATS